MMDQQEMPFWAVTQERISRLNDFKSRRSLRRYQAEIAQRGCFSLPSPFNGDVLQPVANYLLPNRAVLYLFQDRVPFVLIATSLKDGYPISTLVTGTGAVWKDRQISADLIALAQDLLRSGAIRPLIRAERPEVHLGHPNFAHCLWNEVPALRTLLQCPQRAEIMLHHDPLDVLSRLAPHAGRVRDPAHYKGWSNRPVTLIGAERCQQTDLAEVRGLLRLSRPAPVAGPPRMLITLRDKGRTMANQVPFLLEVIRRLSEKFPGVAFLLDGFSCPVDQAHPIYGTLRPTFQKRIAGGQALAAQIMHTLPGIPIRDLTGLPLDVALSEISRCAFYLAHAGTMQHKAAWLCPLPGIIHGNQASLTPGALNWCADMVEGSLRPAGLSPHLIEDLTVRDMPNQNARNRDYRVTNISAAAQEVLTHFEKALKDGSRRRAG